MSELREIMRRLDTQDRALQRLEEKVDKTNGRVRKHEVILAEMRGAKKAVGFIPPLVTSLVASGFSVLLYAIFLTH